jgi:two-component system OmpR family response regulator
VRQAASAAEAREAIGAEVPDLVLLDIMMPGEDGLSLCRHLTETRAIPTIFLTARGERPTASWGWKSAPTIMW